MKKTHALLNSLTILITLLSQLNWTLASAEELLNPPHSDPALIGVQGLLGTIAPNIRPLPQNLIKDHRISLKVMDGTSVGALFFPQSGAIGERHKLFVCNFGLFVSAGDGATSYFVNSLVETGLIDGDVLIVDSMTTDSFLNLNNQHEFGLGGYDEGRLMLEISQQYKTRGHNSQIYLIGVSLGGNAVIQALLEDSRLNTQVFSGGLTFSGVLDEASSTQAIMSSFGHPLVDLPESRLSNTGRLLLAHSFSGLRLDNEPAPGTTAQNISNVEFLYKNFAHRLQRLANLGNNLNWNPAVSLTSPDAYVLSSSALIHHLDQLKVPLIVIHAKNDPIVPFTQFKAFAKEYEFDPLIMTHATNFGGHWGFFDTYGTEWVQDLISRLKLEAQKN